MTVGSLNSFGSGKVLTSTPGRVQRMSTLMRPLKTRKGQPAYVDLLKVRQRFGLWRYEFHRQISLKMQVIQKCYQMQYSWIHHARKSTVSTAQQCTLEFEKSAVRWLDSKFHAKQNVDLSRKESPVQASTSNILLSHALMSILYPDQRRPTCHLAVSHVTSGGRWRWRGRGLTHNFDAQVHMINRIWSSNYIW